MERYFTCSNHKAKYLQYFVSILAFIVLLLTLSSGVNAEDLGSLKRKLNPSGETEGGTVVVAGNEFLAAPVASDAEVPLNENTQNGTAVHTVVAQDTDGEALTYTIIAGNGAGAFQILDAATGQITVADASKLNYEITPQFVLEVKVSDGTASDTANITINIQDVEETPPPAPTVTVVDNCDGTSTLTASNYTGELKWSTGATTSVITVSEAGTYSVTQTVNGLESEPDTGVADPGTKPAAPGAEDGRHCGPGVVEIVASGGVTNGYRWYRADGSQIVDANGAPVTTAVYTTPELSATETYYVSVVNTDGCESAKTEVQAIIKSVPDAPVVEAQRFCSSANPSVASLPQNEGAFNWYASASSTSELSPSTALATGTYYVTTTVDGCESNKTAVSVTVDPASVGGTVASPATVCYNANSGTLQLSGQTGDIIRWESSLDGTNWTPIANTTISQSYSNLTKTTRYRAVVQSGICAEVTSTSATITVKPEIIASFSGITDGATYYSGESNKTLSGGSPAGGTFSGPGVSTTGTGNNKATVFSPCTALGDANEKTVSITYSGVYDGCTYSISKTVTVKRSTYAVTNVVSEPYFPICKGQNTSFTAVVYRDVQVIYPYINSPTDISLRNNAVYNEAYTAYFFAKFGREPSLIEKTYPERLLQPIVINPNPALSIQQQLNVSHLVVPASDFSYQWERNGGAQGNDKDVRSIAALSSTDYIRVLVKPKNTNNCITWSGPTVSNGGVQNGMPSNFLFFSEPDYSLVQADDAPPVNICAGDNSVEIAFSQGSFKWTETNAEITWKLRRDGVEYSLATIAIPPDATEAQLSDYFSLTAEEIRQGLESQSPPVSPAELVDGDEVFIDYVSDIDRVVRQKCGTSGEANRSEIVDVVVNDISAQAEDQSMEVCQTGSGSFTLNVTATGTAPVTYQWYLNGTLIEGQTSGTITIEDAQYSDEGVYSVEVTNGCEEIGPLDVGTLTIEPLSVVEAELEYTWIDQHTWEIRAVEKAPIEPGGFGSKPTFVWYRRDNSVSPEWDIVQEGPSDTYIERNSSANVEIMAEVVNTTSCILYNLSAPDNSNPLPVELFSFKAEQQGGDVLLKWSTAMEKDNTGFEVQVSSDAKNYRPVAFVKTQNGNSSAIQEYEFIHKEPGLQGSLYYRLKQIDVDGTASFHGPVHVGIEARNEVSFYPNPFNTELKAEIRAEGEGELFISVTNAVGAQLLQQTIQIKEGVSIEELIFDSSLQSGVYIVSVRMNGFSKRYRLLKQ
ncbi:Ig-like domain-containing protein [Nafulsella turpanensis]|uniref:Ig-like domain-containing protein n=1 Tax=Nafulsella turpanensis TaxID=1265690 RepID=UPI00135F1152|nr:cadherin domain-containing protein [Nafulsella turpanensis]